MTEGDAAARADVARKAAVAGAAVAEDAFRQGIDVETKSNKTDVVTRADREVQRLVWTVVRESYPDDALVGEEEDAAKTVPESGAAWVVDPIDGTNNFVADIPVWTTSVAAVVDGEPVAGASALPALGDTYAVGPTGVSHNGDPVTVSEKTDPETFTVAPTIWWGFDRRDEYAAACREIVERFGDLRRFGCAQATLAMVASGALEGTVTNVAANPWDTVAGAYMVECAGGTVTDVHGDPWRHDSRGLVASNGEAHEDLLAVAQAAEAVREG